MVTDVYHDCKKKAVCAAALLQLIFLCCDAQKPYFQCEICHIYPNSFGQLQDVISSNRHIILNGVEFNVNGRNGFTLIENVSNLTISSAEKEGSIIKCSSESTFGLHLKNSTNISLTGITITNCASYIPTHMMQYQYNTSQYNEATLLIETPRNINLSKVHIKHSLGVAMAIFDFIFQGPSIAMDVVNFNLTLINCTISHSREESLVIFGTTSLLIERTLITNSSIGIDTYKADILIKYLYVSNCISSSVVAGQVMVIEGLQMTNNSLTISESIILFIGDKTMSGLTVNDSVIFVKENSVLQFQMFSGTVLILTQSFFTLDNSTMTFTQNNVHPQALFRESHISVSNGSTLSITNNTLTHGILMSWNNCSIIVNSGILLIEENECQYSDLIQGTNNTIITWKNGSNFNFNHNSILAHSAAFHLLYGWMNFSESFLVANNNSLSNVSILFYYEASSLIISASKLFLDNNKCYNVSSLLWADSATTKMEMGTLIASNNSLSYWGSVLYYQSFSLIISASQLLLEDNKCHYYSALL